MAAAFRGQDLTDRPSRFVMLVGPTPGVEYPLDRERMTIGRAEDASISVNHNSVSRLHCEVHALGDGRYEIVDKGSSNGVRVNAVELKRSIIEAGDVIELGDVRFKFVGAGQVFVPGPNESQQLTAISDREAELADPRRKGWAGYALPIIGAGVVGALIIIAFVFLLKARANTETPQGGGITSVPDTDQAVVAEAKRTCTPDECDAAYQQLMGLPEKSPWRGHKDFREIENTWADSTMKRAAGSSDLAVKRALLTKVSAATTLDEVRRAKVAAALAELDQPAATPSQLPVATAPSPTTSAPVAPATTPPAPPSGVRPPPPHATTATTTAPAVTPPPTTATVKPATGQSVLEKATEAAAEGRSADVRRFLEAKVRAGHGNPEEVRLVRKACSSPFDKACVEDIKAKYP